MKRLLLAAGLVIALTGCGTETSPPATTAAQPAVPVTKTVALRVPTMHCPVACWPNVQNTLAGEPGVGTVTLAEQADKNAIDNPVVYVGVNDDFNLDQAIAALDSAGFKNAKVETK